MNKSELIKKVAAKMGATKVVATDAVDAVFSVITEELASHADVRLPGFGNFSVSERAASEVRNPRTGEPIRIEAQKIPKFKAGKALKTAVNEETV